MKNIKFVSLLSGITILATTMFGGVAHATTAGSMTLSGTTAQTNGSFTATINETSTDTVNYAEAHLTFSAAVQNVVFSYNGAFVGQPCGTNCAGGYIAAGGSVTGTNPLATVSFTLVSPGSVTVGFDGSSYMAHPVPGSVSQTVAVTGSSSTYSYTAPVSPPTQPTHGGSTNTGSTSNNSSSNTASTGNSKSTTTTSPSTSANTPSSTTSASTTTTPKATPSKQITNKQQSKPKYIKSHHTGLVTSSLAALVIIAAGVYWLMIRKRAEVAPAAAVYKLDDAGSKSTAKKAVSEKTTSSKVATTRKPAVKKTKKA